MASAPKTLSNGTLSLRFMQKAQRTQQQKQVELERAAVKDEAEWEVSPEVRRAWGLTTTSTGNHDQTAQVVTCETSFLPFIFGSATSEDEPGPSSRPNGRRTFNKKGEETSVRSDLPEEEPVKPPNDSDTSPPKGKMYARPSSISLSSSKNVMVPKKSGKNERSAFTSSRDMIFGFAPDAPPPDFLTAGSANNTNLDEKPLVRTDPEPSSSTSKVSRSFMKPAGVDSPSKPPHQSATIKTEEALPNGARKEKKSKRTRLDSESTAKSEAPKKKKKKQNTEQ